MAERADRRWPRLPLRQALHPRRHPSLLLSRFRRDGRPAARCREYQHRRMVRPRRREAIGEGVSAAVVVPAPDQRLHETNLILRRAATRSDAARLEGWRLGTAVARGHPSRRIAGAVLLRTVTDKFVR